MKEYGPDFGGGQHRHPGATRGPKRRSAEELTWSKVDSPVGARIRTIRPSATATGTARPGRRPARWAKSPRPLHSPPAGTRIQAAMRR
jgi:hypothetical protein